MGNQPLYPITPIMNILSLTVCVLALSRTAFASDSDEILKNYAEEMGIDENYFKSMEPDMLLKYKTLVQKWVKDNEPQQEAEPEEVAELNANEAVKERELKRRLHQSMNAEEPEQKDPTTKLQKKEEAKRKEQDAEKAKKERRRRRRRRKERRNKKKKNKRPCKRR